MRSWLGPVNLALVSLYFAPVWGVAAVRALVSPYNGFEDRVQATVAIYFRELFDLGLNGLLLTSQIFSGIKLVIAAGFVVYLIEFARSAVIRRDLNRETMDVVLMLAVVGIVIWALPAIALADRSLIPICASQIVLIAGAIVVVTVERHIEATLPRGATAVQPPRLPTVELEQETIRTAIGVGTLVPATTGARTAPRSDAF
jgi:hypothetical protein